MKTIKVGRNKGDEASSTSRITIRLPSEEAAEMKAMALALGVKPADAYRLVVKAGIDALTGRIKAAQKAALLSAIS